MDTELEIARMQLERIKVAASRAEMDFNIKQRQSEIRRFQVNIQNQLAREAELDKSIAELAAKNNSAQPTPNA